MASNQEDFVFVESHFEDQQDSFDDDSDWELVELLESAAEDLDDWEGVDSDDEYILVGALDNEAPPPPPDQLPTAQITQQQVSDDLECTFCLDAYVLGETVCVSACKHYFHVQCLAPWRKQHSTCPVCRQKVTPS